MQSPQSGQATGKVAMSSRFTEEKDDRDVQLDTSEPMVEGTIPSPSTVRIVVLTFSMIMTFFLGVRHNVQSVNIANGKSQTVSGTAVTLVIPAMARDLNTTELQVQWVCSRRAHILGLAYDVQVASAYSLAYGWCVLIFLVLSIPLC
jgi:hypothetical protein